LHLFATTSADRILALGKRAAFVEADRAAPALESAGRPRRRRR
jgi:hypothetical protein